MVQIEGLDRLLEKHPFFQGMDPGVYEVIAGCASNESYKAGEIIFREGGNANRFYILRHGQVALEIRLPGRKPLIFDTVHEGEVFGWSWMVPPYKWFSDARATQLVRMLSLDAACLRGKMEDDHTLSHELFKRFVPIMAKRLRANRLQLVDMFSQPDNKE